MITRSEATEFLMAKQTSVTTTCARLHDAGASKRGAHRGMVRLLVIFIGVHALAQTLKTPMIQPIPAPAASHLACWRSSLVILSAGNAIDTASSYGYSEKNPMLRSSGGHFETRGILVKAGIVGAAGFIEYGILRRTHSARVARFLAAFNTAIGGTTAAMGVHNYTVRSK